MTRFGIACLVELLALAFASNVRGAGILAPRDVSLPPLRVTEHLVDVAIRDQIALTTLNQTFHNDTNQQLEATYVFPLPDNAQLTDFQMSFNGKMVEGEVLPADKARQIYESIVRQSRDPGLIEFIGRRLLQMRVFPIPPGSDTMVQVKYQQICKPVSGMSGYHYPLRTAKTTGQVYGTVRFSAKLETASPLKNVWSPTHSVEIVREGEHVAKVAYEASKGSLEDDFLLLYDTDSSDLGMSVIAFKPRESRAGHFVLTLTPKQLWPKGEYQPQDVVFVIDTSGSMAGEKIDQARAALKYCIDQLQQEDRFNVVRFSTGVDGLFEELRPATNDNCAKARQRIGEFTAAGGTNIAEALKQALDLRERGDRENAGDDLAQRPFVIVFITDGMGNQTPEETLKMVQKHSGSQGARIFSFGVGHDVNTIMLDQLANNFSGKPTYVQPGENLELALGDFFSVISQPVLTNLRLVLPEIGATEKFPASLGDLYHGQQLIVAGKFDEPMTGPVKLIATRNGKEEEFIWPSVAFVHTPEAKYVPSIWAGRKISYLIDQIRAHGETNEMISEIIALSQEHGIQTPYSSWLVNPEQIPVARRQVMHPWQRGRPAGDGGGGGFGGSPAKIAGQRAAVSRAGVEIEELDGDDALPPSEIAAGFPGADAIAQSTGEVATTLAKTNAALREARSKDDGARFNQANLPSRKIGDRWYHRIGQFLVDEDVNEQTAITTVRFGSPAYFEIARQRPELRLALAASRNIVVQTGENVAILVSDSAGIEEFSDEQLKQAGLEERKEPQSQ